MREAARRGAGRSRLTGTFASDLSLGGLYCTSTTLFPEMTRLSVRLLLPDFGDEAAGQEPLDVEAVVVRGQRLPSSTGSSRYELALFFTSTSSSKRNV